MAPAVCLRDAVALAGTFPLLAGVSLQIDEGEVVHVRGPNGAGKTSLLRLCCGLEALHSGVASVLGHDLATDRRAVRRSVGLLGHQSFLYEDLTVEENLRYSLRACGADPANTRGALLRLDLGGRLSSTAVGRLSAGQRRRTALALLVARDPRLWLLDEPHAGLDQQGRDLLDELIGESRAKGRTVLISSHEHDRAEAVSDRVVRLAGGQVVEKQISVA
ncbi:MAG: heme ABC exporter ATP-binding protein CcmA [Acidimicrobiales bacterium]